MTITEASRHRLHEALIDKLGEEEASTLMEHLPPVGWADVATKTDLEHLHTATKGDLDAIRIATKADLDSHRAATKADLDSLRAEFAAVRSEIAHVCQVMDLRFESFHHEMTTGFARSDALLHAKLNTQLRWMIGTMIASYAVIAALAGIWR